MSEHRRSSNTTRRHTDSGVRPAQVLRVQTAGRCVVSDEDYLRAVLNCDDQSGMATDAAWRAVTALRNRADRAEAAIERVRQALDNETSMRIAAQAQVQAVRDALPPVDQTIPSDYSGKSLQTVRLADILQALDGEQ